MVIEGHNLRPGRTSAENAAGYLGLIKNGGRELSLAGTDAPSREAGILLCAAAGRDKSYIYLHPDEKPADPVIKTYYSYIGRRAKKEPVQYIIGEWEFMGLPFFVDKAALIPRPDTEVLTEYVICNAGKGAPRILDLCTGSGCVAISIAAYIKGARAAAAAQGAREGAGVVASDISGAALELAKKNAELNRVSEKIAFVKSDLFGALGAYGSFDVICANPPYIPTGELPSLPPDVVGYEPVIALNGGEDGLGFFRRIAEGARGFLRDGGLLAMEVGSGQADDVSQILYGSGYGPPDVKKDLNGVRRVVAARINRAQRKRKA